MEILDVQEGKLTPGAVRCLEGVHKFDSPRTMKIVIFDSIGSLRSFCLQKPGQQVVDAGGCGSRDREVAAVTGQAIGR